MVDGARVEGQPPGERKGHAGDIAGETVQRLAAPDQHERRSGDQERRVVAHQRRESGREARHE